MFQILIEKHVREKTRNVREFVIQVCVEML